MLSMSGSCNCHKLHYLWCGLCLFLCSIHLSSCSIGFRSKHSCKYFGINYHFHIHVRVCTKAQSTFIKHIILFLPEFLFPAELFKNINQMFKVLLMSSRFKYWSKWVVGSSTDPHNHHDINCNTFPCLYSSCISCDVIVVGFISRSASFTDDHSRVRLERNHLDYINASLVEYPEANRSYILTQVCIIQCL